MTFRILVDGAELPPMKEVSVSTGLDSVLSTLDMISESPVFGSLGGVPSSVIQVFIGDDLVFTGNYDIIDDTHDAEVGNTQVIQCRSLARNAMDSHIIFGNQSTPSPFTDVRADTPSPAFDIPEFTNATLVEIFNRTLRSQGFPEENEVVNRTASGAQQIVEHFEWFEADNIGTEFQRLCEEFNSVLTDDERGRPQILNGNDFRTSSINLRYEQFKSYRLNLNLSRNFRLYAGYASQDTKTKIEEVNDNNFYVTGAFRSGRLYRNFAKVHKTVQSIGHLRRAVLYDAYRRRDNGMQAFITLPGLHVYRKGVKANLTLPADVGRGLGAIGWVVNSVVWESSSEVAKGNTTQLILSPETQYIDQAAEEAVSRRLSDEYVYDFSFEDGSFGT